MGRVRQSLLILSVLLSCSPDPREELNQKLPSYFVFHDAALEPLGGWARLQGLQPGRLPSPLLIPWGDTVFVETNTGLGAVRFRGGALVWEPFSPAIRSVISFWRWRDLYLFAEVDGPALYRWTPFAAPEAVLIPTRLAEPERARPLRVELVDGEWLFHWAPPLNRWTLFHPGVGLERQLTPAEVSTVLQKVAPAGPDQIPADYLPYLPEGAFQILLHDERQEPTPQLYRRGPPGGASLTALRSGNAVWVLDTGGLIRGSGGEARLTLGNGVRTVGLGALSSGLVVAWRRETGAGTGHRGLIHVPWQFLQNRGIVER